MTVAYDLKHGIDEFGEAVYPGDRVIALTKSWGYPGLFKGTFLGINETTFHDYSWGNRKHPIRTYTKNRYVIADDAGGKHYLRANRVVKV